MGNTANTNSVKQEDVYKSVYNSTKKQISSVKQTTSTNQELHQNLKVKIKVTGKSKGCTFRSSQKGVLKLVSFSQLDSANIMKMSERISDDVKADMTSENKQEAAGLFAPGNANSSESKVERDIKKNLKFYY